MTTIREMAHFVTGTASTALPSETVEHVKMHILDSIGAMMAGPQTPEGMAIGKLVSEFLPSGHIPVIGYPIKTDLLSAIIAECSATRCTEVDDYHHESLITPGSVIVPIALSLVSAGYLPDPADFLGAVAIGYEILIRLGLAIDGPKLLLKGIWPTYIVAAIGSAAVASRASELTDQQTASALATALALCAGMRVPVGAAVSSRWLTLGIAAQNGVIAAFSARAGLVGDLSLLDKTFGNAHGLMVAQDKIVAGLGKQFHVGQTGFKPFPVAGQALSAVEAFQDIVANYRIAPKSIERVSIWVPKKSIPIINRPNLPSNRLETVISVQYQIALAAFDPIRLLDVKREKIIDSDQVCGLIGKIHVMASEEFDNYHASALPAKVEVRSGGQTYSREVVYPKGDARNPFGWDDVISKFRWVTQSTLEAEAAAKVVKMVRVLDLEIKETSQLVALL